MTTNDFAIDALAGLSPMTARDRLAETLDKAEIDTLTQKKKIPYRRFIRIALE